VTLYEPVTLEGRICQHAFDEAIDRQSHTTDPARIAAVIASDARFSYFGTSAFAIRLLRLDKKIASGMPMTLRRVANILSDDSMLFRNSAM
jgi:hypothetical protein